MQMFLLRYCRRKRPERFLGAGVKRVRRIHIPPSEAASNHLPGQILAITMDLPIH
jgi:hypothetical protein